MSLVLDLVYLLGLVLVGPFYLLSRLVKRKRLASPWRRLGNVDGPGPGPGPIVWLHAVSVGETLALRGVVSELRRRLEGVRLVLSCTTVTGLAIARRTYPDIRVVESPFDLSFAVRRFFDRVRPEVLVLAELEIWPNWLAACRRRGVPVLVANAKISEGSFGGYRRLRRILPRLFDPVVRWLAQTEAHAERLRALGIEPERVRVLGNVKFDNVRLEDPAPERAVLRKQHGFPAEAPLLVAGSTHAGEEGVVLDALRALRRRSVPLRLVLCPRHPERIGEVTALVRAAGFEPGFRSKPDATADPTVLLVDTMGELARLYALGDVALIGGTFVPIGGHNLLEPAGLGLPLVVGRYLDTVQESASALREAGALQVVSDAPELAALVFAVLADAGARERATSGAREVIIANRGSVARTVDEIVAALPAPPKESRKHV